MMSTKSLSTLIAVACFFLAIVIPAPAQTFSTLSTLNSTTGEYPLTPLVQGFDGNLYGTASNYGAYGSGTVFQLTLSGDVTPLYSFCQNNVGYGCPDGALPMGSIALGTDGNFYGITSGSFLDGLGAGTVYKVTPQGALTTLHTFCTTVACADGAYPTFGLAMSRSGNFYGLSNAGARNPNAFYGQVFEISSTGSFHNVLTVCPNTLCPADAGPIGTLLLSNGGTFIGPGPGPGYNSANGAFYSMTPSGTPTPFYSFCDDSLCHSGSGYNATPFAESPSGQVFGTFQSGGVGTYCTQTGGCGTAFRVTPGGVFTKLHDFCSLPGCADGFNSNPLILASDGNLYGTTNEGGSHNYGTLFRITSTGHFSLIHSFTAADGAAPMSIPLVQATDGNFYGATRTTIFRLSLGLAPFVKTVLNSGTAGSNVIILGDNLTGSTSVTFNGVSASFTVVSATEISATVPTGATTGTIKVVTPTSTLSSNIPFEVLP
jgi:uncharacterized repeat protein (TIGR03803 family)